MSETESKQIFAKKFGLLLAETGLSQVEVAALLSVSTSTVSSWCLAQRMPRMDKIERLSEIFSVPRSYFVEEDPAPLDPELQKTEQDLKLLARHLKELPAEQRERLIENFRETVELYYDAMEKKKGGGK